jgi:hypothetical protein
VLQGLRVYEHGRLLSAWQDRLSDAVQAQLAALFSSACSLFSQLGGGTKVWTVQTAAPCMLGSWAHAPCSWTPQLVCSPWCTSLQPTPGI